MNYFDTLFAKRLAGGGGGGVAVNEVTYADLVAAKTNGTLKVGALYRITDYVTKINGTYDLTQMAGGTPTYVHYAKSAEHAFDLVVCAIDESTLDEHAIAIQHDGDTYFANSDLTAWDVKYTTENDTTKYAWADATNGKGVIYYLKDEFGNEAGYDFKNAQFLAYAITTKDENETDVLTDLNYDASLQPNRYGSVYYVFMALQNYMQSGSYASPFPTAWNKDFSVGYAILGTAQFATVDATYLSTFNADWYYTFDRLIDGAHIDHSLNSRGKVWCFGNHIEECQDSLATTLQLSVIPMGLGANIFEECGAVSGGYEDCYSNRIKVNSFLNIFGSNCFANEFDEVCVANAFGNNCVANAFGNSCNYNAFGNDCDSNAFGNSCYYNAFGNSCGSNAFGNSCYYNAFGNSCDSNAFGNDCNFNAFGNNCGSNAFGNNCGSNAFGNDCNSNAFGNDCNYNAFGNDCNYNAFGNGCGHNAFGNSCNYNELKTSSNNNELNASINNCTFEAAVSQIVLNNPDGSNVAKSLYTVQSGNYWEGVTQTTITMAYRTYPTYVGKNSSGVVKEWTPADLVQ